MQLEDHFCVSVRTSKCYTQFTIFQLILTSVILILCYTSSLELALYLEIIITFCLGMDLYFLINLGLYGTLVTDTFSKINITFMI